MAHPSMQRAITERDGPARVMGENQMDPGLIAAKADDPVWRHAREHPVTYADTEFVRRVMASRNIGEQSKPKRTILALWGTRAA